MTTVAGSGRGDLEPLAGGGDAVAEPAAGRIVGDGKREEHVGGGERGAIGEGDALAQVQRVRPSIGCRVPALGERGFERVGHPIEANETCLGEDGHQIGSGAGVEIAAVVDRLAAQRGDELAATLRPGRGRRR